MKLSILLFYMLLFQLAIANVEDTQTVVTDNYTYKVLPTSVYKEILPEKDMTILGLTLGKNSLQDVQTKLGKAKLLYSREHEPLSICYIAKDSTDTTAAIFQAWDMSTQLTAFSILSDQNKINKYKQCTKSQLISRDMSTDGGLRISLDQNSLKQILGKPTTEINGNLLYVYHAKNAMTQEEISGMKKVFKKKIPPQEPEDWYWDVYSSIEVIFKNNKVIEFTITKTETN